MAQEEKKDAAEAKREPRGGTQRRRLFIGVGSTVALLGLGGLRYAGTTPEPAARRHRRGSPGERLYPLRTLLRGVSAPGHRAGED
ncbi:MAG: hypothetical protein ACLTDR_04050 [Adlercreutzia equolifaciens]